jgi:hypothetical protein
MACRENLAVGLQCGLESDCNCHFEIVMIGLEAVVDSRFDFRFNKFCGEGYISIAILEGEGEVYLYFGFFDECSEPIKFLPEEIVP